MMIRARAPLRLGLAGGGTDVSPYCDLFGGAVMNTTISHYAYTTLELIPGTDVTIESADQNMQLRYDVAPQLQFNGKLDLIKAVYNRVVRDYCDGKPFSLRISTYSEAPPGSGLGSSSALVVSLVAAFDRLLSMSLGEYDIAHLAYEIERVDAKLHGGRQDQYAAAFGGFNFMEFHKDNHVIINPLRIKESVIHELEAQMVLCFTGISRDSATIISEQSKNVQQGEAHPIEAMHMLKSAAIEMKEALLKGDLARIATTMQSGWNSKIAMAKGITNSHIDKVQETAMKAGAYAGKISGAGGGGFMMFLAPPEKKHHLITTLESIDCRIMSSHFTAEGARAWRVKE